MYDPKQDPVQDPKLSEKSDQSGSEKNHSGSTTLMRRSGKEK
jgi:hypothetical protein